jgi:elongation factor P
MLTYFELRKGIKFILDGQPYEVLEFSQMKKAQGEGIAQTKIRNLITGKIFDKTFHQGNIFEEAELEKIEIKYIFFNREKYYFSEIANPSKRFELTEKQVGPGIKFLKPNQILTGILFQKNLINVVLPIKIHLRVIEAPPGIKGNRANPGTKPIVLETGAKINAPLFIEVDDIVEVNVETNEYVRRII